MALPDFPRSPDVLLKDATVPGAMCAGGDPAEAVRRDILVSGGRIAGILPPGAVAPDGAGVYDMRGGLVLPAFVDIHTHIDKGHIWPRRPNPDGTWLSALLSVAADRERLWAAGDVERRMAFSLRCAYAHGTAALRTHLDGVPPQDEISWPVFAEMRERWAGRIELQAVSLVAPDNLLDRPTLRRIAERTRDFGGILGGALREHPESRQAMRNVVETAGELGLDLDIHADETGDPSSSALLHLAEAVLETGYRGRGSRRPLLRAHRADEATQRKTIDKAAEAGIAVVSLPMCNLYLQDRDGTAAATPLRRGVTLLKEMKAGGMPVAIASDNTRDLFYAYGDLDALEVLREGARILHFDHPQEEAWAWARTVAGAAASIAGFAYRAEIAEGAPADLILFRARSDGVARAPASRQDRAAWGRSHRHDAPDYRELDDLMEA